MGSFSGGGGGGSYPDHMTTTTRYAAYIEDHHEAFLNVCEAYRKDMIGEAEDLATVKLSVMEDLGASGYLYDSLVTRSTYREELFENATTYDSPFITFTGINETHLEEAFFTTGYTIASFPSMYDMYGKFMAGLDIDILYDQIFEDTVNSPEVNDLVAAEAALIDDDIESNSLPRFQVGMRDINSVMASTYIVGKAMIEDARVKALEKFRAELKYRLIPVAAQRWQTHLEWNKGVIMTYAEVMKLYYSLRMDITGFNHENIIKHELWPFTVLDYERAFIGALQGATTSKQVAGDSGSKFGDALSGTLSGAAAGYMVGGVGGAVVGGVLGLAGSLF